MSCAGYTEASESVTKYMTWSIISCACTSDDQEPLGRSQAAGLQMGPCQGLSDTHAAAQLCMHDAEGATAGDQAMG